MAKEYMSVEEVCEALGVSEDQVKNLVDTGKLREYRDAGKIFYKRGEVEASGGKEGSSVVDLEAADEAAPEEISLDDHESFASALSSLADSSASLGAIDESPAAEEPPDLEPASGDDSAAAPAELDIDAIPEELPAAPKTEFSSEIDLMPGDGQDSAADLDALVSDSADDILEDVPDLGLSGSSIISLEPSGDSSMAQSPVAKEGTKFSKVGISVFDDDELEIETDPMGETQISSGVGDFDAVGSGSGLLDLTQESDDTSLGAELLDVISPSDAIETVTETGAIAEETISEEGSSIVAVTEAVEETKAQRKPAVKAAARVATGEMAGAVPMNICLLIGILGMAALGLATAAILQGAWPSVIMDPISKGVVHWSVFGGLALAAIVTGVFSILSDRGK